MTFISPVKQSFPAKEPTPQRLMRAATKLIANKGYSATSVREITAAAACNLAAVNYHFGSKQGLYEQLFKDILSDLRDQRILAVRNVLDEAERQDLEKVLYAFTHAFLNPLMELEQGHLMVQLFMREMADPHLPPRLFIEQMVEPMQKIMVEALQRTCHGIEPPQAVLSLHSLVAQLIHVVQTRRLFRGVDHSRMSTLNLDQIVEHIVRFTAAGVRQYQKDYP